MGNYADLLHCRAYSEVPKIGQAGNETLHEEMLQCVGTENIPGVFEEDNQDNGSVLPSARVSADQELHEFKGA